MPIREKQNKTNYLGFFLLFIGLVLVFAGFDGTQFIGERGIDGIASFIFIPVGFFLLYIAYKQNLRFSKEIREREEKIIAEEKERHKAAQILKAEQDPKTKLRLQQAESLKIKLAETLEIEIVDISDFKNSILVNEKIILDKGADNQLFMFLKIDSFLRDYRDRIISDQSELTKMLDFEWLKSRIKSESERNDLDKLTENLEGLVAKLEGGKPKGFEANVDKLFEIGDLMKPALENQIKTLGFYRDLAMSMLVFYIHDKKVRYFEIYEAFDKLGVFDSSWQKNVLGKLDNIEIRLSQISNQLTELNKNFVSIVESSESIVLELKEINSSIMTNNMLQAITAFQTWKVNKNTKSLR
ncbi:MAG: hypothetical protein RLZZ358_2308 [Bacteroidota bacterium]|jgi:hypothetical protein